jgi:hypothetical protein
MRLAADLARVGQGAALLLAAAWLWLAEAEVLHFFFERNLNLVAGSKHM